MINADLIGIELNWLPGWDPAEAAEAAAAALYNYTLKQQCRVWRRHMAFSGTGLTYEVDNRTSEIRTLLRKLPATFRLLCLLDCGI